MFRAATPRSSMFEIRQVTVRVFPVPAPARIITGPSMAPTASRCALFNDSNENPSAMRARVKTELAVNYNPETHTMENSCGTGSLLKSKFISDFQDKKNCRLQTA
jgi:hypothetical protein